MSAFSITLEAVVPLFLFAVVSTGTPGPNNVMLTASGANFGYRRSLPHVLGVALGFPAMITGVGLGLGAVFELYPVLQQVMAGLGICYLLYLSWRIAMTGKSEAGEKKGKPLTFLQAALFQWINPKAWVMALSALSAFTQFGQGFAFEVLLTACVFAMAGLPLVSLWTLFGVGIGRVLTDQKRLRIFNVTMALLLVGSIAPVAWRLAQDLAL